MANRRRITAALIGLIGLVLGGWLVQNAISGDGSDRSGGDFRSTGASSTPVAGPTPASGADSAGKADGSESTFAVKPLSSLPPEAADTWKLITTGGPFPYPREDAGVFGNRQNLLPFKKTGYYHEYTVKTPGSRDRGIRRLITGQSREVYYTGDHYSSFVVVDTNQ